MPTDSSNVIGQRRAAAKAKLAATSAADVVWADSAGEDETDELDQEVLRFRLRLESASPRRPNKSAATDVAATENTTSMPST